MSKRPTRWPAIPLKPGDPVSDLVNQWRGGRDPMDRVLTYRDLVQSGLAQVRGAAGADGLMLEPAPDPGGRAEAPAAPSGVEASGGFGHVLLSWARPAYRGHSHTEIWRADADNRANAVLNGEGGGPPYVDFTVDDGATYFYWLRHVNRNGLAGPWHALHGVMAAVAANSDYVRDTLTATRWRPGYGYSLFEVVSPVNPVFIGGAQVSFQVSAAGISGSGEPAWGSVTQVGGQLIDGGVTWTAVDVSKVPFVAGELDGRPVVFMPGAVIQDASIDDAKIKMLNAAKLFAQNATVLELIANAAEVHRLTVGHNIQSGDYQAGVKGWRIAGDGSAELRNVIARGDVEASSIKANAANIIDTLHIRGQAVTFSDQVFTLGEIGVGSSWVSVQAITLTTTGAPVLIIASFSAEYVSGSSGDTVSHYARVLRDDGSLTGDILIGKDNFDKVGARMVAIPVRDHPPSGAHTYIVQYRADRLNHRASARSIFVQETKR